MGHQPNRKRPSGFRASVAAGILVMLSLVVVAGSRCQAAWPQISPATATPEAARAGLATATPTPGRTPAPTATPTPSPSPTHTATPTPTLDLAGCNAAGCGAGARPLPTAEDHFNLFLTRTRPARRICADCPQNPQLSQAQLNELVGADPAILARLHAIALSQETYELAPGVVYIVFDHVHHVVVDLEEPGYVLRNIIPEAVERGALITPSYCMTDKSLVVTTADYHGLDGSNKTETGRDLFFHLGRAALFQLDGRYDIRVIREREEYDRTAISWGGGPLFIWNGRYNFNPEQEWFEPDALDHYRTKRWAKITAAVSKDRKYLFLTVSYGLTLEEHAQNIIELGQRWGIDIDRAMRFDGSESAYMALRLGRYLVPVLNLEEPLIVNCLAIERP